LTVVFFIFVLFFTIIEEIETLYHFGFSTRDELFGGTLRTLRLLFD
jgi:hypothetical protein